MIENGAADVQKLISIRIEMLKGLGSMFSSKGSNWFWLFQCVKHQKRSERKRANCPHTCFSCLRDLQESCEDYS